jgi:serine/threonine-protein kinase HipA
MIYHSKNDLLTVGQSIKSKKAFDIIVEINETVSHWRKFADKVSVAPGLRDEIANTLSDVMM